jgi:purine-cytosine permease-like protein
MVLSRLGFGYWGNVLPAGLNALAAGIGWFAVNSVSGALALSTLTHLPQVGCLLIVVAVQIAVAFFGYNLVHVFERYAFPVLMIIFLIASSVILAKGHPGAVQHTVPGGFLLTLGATFGYAVGWNPFASDYTRYFKPTVSRAAVAWWSGLGLFLSCMLMETVGAAAATVASVSEHGASALLGSNPTGAFTSLLATPPHIRTGPDRWRWPPAWAYRSGCSPTRPNTSGSSHRTSHRPVTSPSRPVLSSPRSST